MALSIVHVTTFYPPYSFGGDAVHVQRLAAAQVRRGHRVDVVYSRAAFSMLAGTRLPDHVAALDPDDAAPAVHAGRGAAGVLETCLVHQTGGPVLSRSRLARLLSGSENRRPDVIHFHNVSLIGGVGVLNLGAAVKLYTAHEYWLVCPTHLLYRYGREVCEERTCVRCTLHAGRPPQWWRYGRRRDRALRNVDRMLYPSELTRRLHREHGIESCGEVLRHFLPDSYVAGAKALGERRPTAEPYFLYAGRLDGVKGITELARHFASGNPPAPLLVAGDGPLGPELRSRYARHPFVRLLGYCDSARLGELYRDALAVVLPSTGYEVFGQVVAEGFAHGTPAIVSSVSGTRELVEGSAGGSIYGSDVELDAELRRLAAEPDVRRERGQLGRRFVDESLAEQAYMERYEALVEEVRGS